MSLEGFMHIVLKNCTILLTAATLCAIVAAACGGGSEPPASTSAGGASAGQQPTATMAEQPTETMAMTDEPFRVGVMESLTGPGETYGTVSVQAKQMAVDEINAAGGINGRLLELIVEDSKCSAQDAITAYNKLTEVDGVKIILGTSCSGAMLGAAPLAESDGVVLFSGLATNPDIAHAGDYIFRTSMNDLQLGIDTGNVIRGRRGATPGNDHRDNRLRGGSAPHHGGTIRQTRWRDSR